MKTIVDPAAEFVPAARRVFGDLRELWLIEMHGALEHRLSMLEVRGDIEAALRAAKEVVARG